MAKRDKWLFRFKQFDCRHERSAMKIGVDGVLTGAWTDVSGVRSILDVGAGCGLISLMMAQRAPEALVTGVEIDPDAADEMRENFLASRFANRLTAVCSDFNILVDSMIAGGERVDLIVSNPPYFDSGVSDTCTARMAARHQGALSPAIIVQHAPSILTADGRVSMILPAEQLRELERIAMASGMYPVRVTYVKGNPQAPVKRALVELKLTHDSDIFVSTQIEYLTLEDAPGVPTSDHRDLCRPFYLKF